LKRTHKKKLSKAELASITSSRPVVRKIESSHRHENRSRPDARNTVNFFEVNPYFKDRASRQMPTNPVEKEAGGGS
jgi:hypothetical protein